MTQPDADHWRAFLVEARAKLDDVPREGGPQLADWQGLYAEDLLDAAEFFRVMADGVEVGPT